MAQVRTRDEAISSVSRAFQVWTQGLTAILTQAAAVTDGARAEAERVLRRCAARVAAIEAGLATAGEEDRQRLQGELVRARTSHDSARRAAVRIGDVDAAVAALMRSHVNRGETLTAAAQGQLAAMAQGIEQYRAVQAGSSFDGHSYGGGTITTARTTVDPFVKLGLSNVDVALVDLADTPIQGEFGRGGASRADYRWAVQTWSDTVGPGVAKGLTRDDFAARDARNESPPLRRTADVYDMFLGDNRIRVDRRPDGTFNIVNGRHRLQIARDLGITSLPGQVS